MEKGARTGEAFLERWLKEWLPGFNATTKWHKERKQLQEGDIVIAIALDSSRGHWPFAKVTQVFPWKDGKVGVAKIQLGQKLLQRPATKVYNLEHLNGCW